MRILATLAATLALSGAAYAADMTEMDADGDGMLSAEEFAAAYPDAAPELFAAVDLNADGMIDADEFTAATESGGVLAG